MAHTVFHTQLGERPFWYQLDRWQDRDKAIVRARNYAQDHGGYVCVKDAAGKVIFGTDPVDLDCAIARGVNSHFRGVSREAA